MALAEINAPIVDLDRKISFETFLDWVEDHPFAEWVDGEVVLFMSVKEYHQLVVGFLVQIMASFVDLFKLGTVYMIPFGMRLSNSYREPDIFIVEQEQLSQVTESYFQGPALLVVEVISEDSVRRDRDEKFREYRDAGVQEYWIIDPRPGKQRADIYSLAEDGEYHLLATEEDERIESQVLQGFWLRPEWLFPPLPLTAAHAFFTMRGLSARQIDEIENLLRNEPK